MRFYKECSNRRSNLPHIKKFDKKSNAILHVNFTSSFLLKLSLSSQNVIDKRNVKIPVQHAPNANITGEIQSFSLFNKIEVERMSKLINVSGEHEERKSF